jgi:ATP-dependent DNA ligase
MCPIPTWHRLYLASTDPEGSRQYIGALLLGYYTEDGRLRYAGRAGTGLPGLSKAGPATRVIRLGAWHPHQSARVELPNELIAGIIGQ